MHRHLLPITRSVQASIAFVALHAGGAQALEIGGAGNSAVARLAQAVLVPAYARAGIEFKVIPLPLRRSQQMAERGVTDGELIRTAAALNDLPQLIRINVPVVKLVIAVYRRGECPRSTSVAELSQQRVAYYRGTRLIEQMLPESALVPSHDTWNALRSMQALMADAALGDPMEADNLLLAHGVRGVCKIAEPLAEAPLFHALNQRHAAQAARLERVLKAMQASGELAGIWAAEQGVMREEAARQAQATK